MRQHTIFSFLGLWVIAGLALAACAPAATPTAQVVTQVVKETQ